MLLADDHAPTREDMRHALEADPASSFAPRRETRPRRSRRAAREQPDVCLLDISMPGGGMAAAWEISARLPETRIVMLTVSPRRRRPVRALRAGASGYLLKDMDPAQLPDALTTCSRRGCAARASWSRA